VVANGVLGSNGRGKLPSRKLGGQGRRLVRGGVCSGAGRCCLLGSSRPRSYVDRERVAGATCPGRPCHAVAQRNPPAKQARPARQTWRHLPGRSRSCPVQTPRRGLLGHRGGRASPCRSLWQPDLRLVVRGKSHSTVRPAEARLRAARDAPPAHPLTPRPFCFLLCCTLWRRTGGYDLILHPQFTDSHLGLEGARQLAAASHSQP